METYLNDIKPEHSGRLQTGFQPITYSSLKDTNCLTYKWKVTGIVRREAGILCFDKFYEALALETFYAIADRGSENGLTKNLVLYTAR